MPVKSYLAYTKPGEAETFARLAADIPGCAMAQPAGNRDAVIVVTDTASEQTDARARDEIEALPALLGLTLVAAFDAPDDLVELKQ